ncbi:Plant peroxidase [Corchorus olitorius]|uniref:peroxidase n=1 Tax=Corchorus olitorius TaxID=93759 RepID=A0A1R3JPY5_9ROSI|nr:Plant peroxidase [Corchorus olitorius]
MPPTVIGSVAGKNLNLAGDVFDLIVRAKTALELQCPDVVSCSDILVESARNLVIMVGGFFYTVKLGRKDNKVSDPSIVETNLPKVTNPMNQMNSLFSEKGFLVEKMAALTGAQTIGFCHCSQTRNRRK